MSLTNEIARLNALIQKNKDILNDPELGQLAQDEINALEEQKQVLVQAQNSSEQSTHSTDPGDNQVKFKNCILEIRGAAGGDEAKIWAADLLRMYTRFAENQNFKITPLNDDTIKINGENAYSLLQFESGVHRVQRVPETERQGRIHTSTATIVVLPEIPESEIEINPSELDWQFTRAGGPGGQNVNKVATAVHLTHKSTGIVINVRRERSQQQNKVIALDLLRSRLWEIQEEKRIQTIESTRKSAVGRGMRAEKIRTYNFPQNRVTDHRIKKSWKILNEVLNGDLSKILISLSQNLI